MAAGLDRRFEVLVQTEQIRRIVLVLQGDQACILGAAMNRSHPLLPFVAEEVHVDAPIRDRVHGLPEVARPLDVLVGFERIRPHRIDVERVTAMAVLEGGVVFANPPYRAPQLEHNRVRFRR